MWPRQVRTSTGKDVFSKERIKSCIENKYLVCQASDGLSLVPVLANYVQHGLLRNESAAIREHARCFLLLVRVVELMMNSCRFRVASETVRTAIT